jgi:hypothetical protein
MERQVIEDLVRSGSIDRVDRMAIEYHHHHLVSEQDGFGTFLGMLEDASFGYQVEARRTRRALGSAYQDVMVYAYRKGL